MSQNDQVVVTVQPSTTKSRFPRFFVKRFQDQPVFRAALLLLCIGSTAAFSPPASSAIARYLGWGYSDNETYQEVWEYLDGLGGVIAILGYFDEDWEEYAVSYRVVRTIANIIDPDDFTILSGRITLDFDPSQRVVAAGWFGEFGADPDLPAPTIGESWTDIALLQEDGSDQMVESLSGITVDQITGTVVFDFDWGATGFLPQKNMDDTGHFNISGVFFEGDYSTAVIAGSPQDTLENGFDSLTYMYCRAPDEEGGQEFFCGVPEPSTFLLMGLGTLIMSWMGGKAVSKQFRGQFT